MRFQQPRRKIENTIRGWNIKERKFALNQKVIGRLNNIFENAFNFQAKYCLPSSNKDFSVNVLNF